MLYTVVVKCKIFPLKSTGINYKSSQCGGNIVKKKEGKKYIKVIFLLIVLNIFIA